MELINALVLAGPLGFLVRDRRRSLAAWLAVWVVVLPIQTVVLHRASEDSIDALYPVVNAGILALGIGLNVLGGRLGRARRSAQLGRTSESSTRLPSGSRT
jgi:hypothetical protein